MTAGHNQQLGALFLGLLPEDGSMVGNGTLFRQLQAAAQEAGLPCSEKSFADVREMLVTAGQAIRGRGRGGSTGRAPHAAESRPAPYAAGFALEAQVAPAELPFAAPQRAPVARKSTPAGPGDPQVLAYRHPDKRKNNPEVGLVTEQSDPEQPKSTWAYDPHLDPVLQFDSARARTEALIDDALAADDPQAMRAALEELRRQSAPYLQWTGKAKRTSFEVDTVSLHVHERVDPMSILAAVSKGRGEKTGAGKMRGGVQPGLFEAPFESLPLRNAVDFYRHDKGWSNRLVAGDSLLVMNSLLVKEGLAGQVQMIYIDPPYGILYGSNFQPFVNKRDVKDRADADLTQEPEMIKAFRDTWELGIHSYLTYLRDRLLLARELLSESGSVFVQISDENAHLLRNLLDEVFGSANFCAQIVFRKTTGKGSDLIDATCDYILWYARSKGKVKFHPGYEPRSPANDCNLRFLQLHSGRKRGLTEGEINGTVGLPQSSRHRRGLACRGRTARRRHGRRQPHRHPMERSPQVAGTLMHLEIDHAALAEAAEARDYCATASAAVAQDFVHRLDQAFVRIAANPLRWPAYTLRTRRYLMERFPYAVIYRVRQDTIRVLAVSHQHRRPVYWAGQAR